MNIKSKENISFINNKKYAKLENSKVDLLRKAKNNYVKKSEIHKVFGVCSTTIHNWYIKFCQNSNIDISIYKVKQGREVLYNIEFLKYILKDDFILYYKLAIKTVNNKLIYELEDLNNPKINLIEKAQCKHFIGRNEIAQAFKVTPNTISRRFNKYIKETGSETRHSLVFGRKKSYNLSFINYLLGVDASFLNILARLKRKKEIRQTLERRKEDFPRYLANFNWGYFGGFRLAVEASPEHCRSIMELFKEKILEQANSDNVTLFFVTEKNNSGIGNHVHFLLKSELNKNEVINLLKSAIKTKMGKSRLRYLLEAFLPDIAFKATKYLTKTFNEPYNKSVNIDYDIWELSVNNGEKKCIA